MKLTDYAILFVILILPFCFILDITTRSTEEAIYKKTEINRILDTAVDDSATDLLERGLLSKKGIINKEKAVETFFNSLYLNLNIFEDEIQKKRIEGYVPCIVVVDYDGYYLMNNQESYNTVRKERETRLVWNPKRTYAYKDSKYLYYFTLDDFVTVCYKDAEGKEQFLEDTIDNLKTQLTDSDILKDKDLFDRVRRRTIVECIKNDINYSINRHNSIARQYGITYNFTLPVISNEDWYKSVDDTGILVFFQGMPIGFTNERINNFSLGGARMVKAPKFYGELDANTNIKYYHRSSCPMVKAKLEDPDLVMDNMMIFDSKKEAAKAGYLPCRKCILQQSN